MGQSRNEPETASDKGPLFISHAGIAVDAWSPAELAHHCFDGAGQPGAAVEPGPPSQQDGGVEILSAGVESVGTAGL